MDLTGDKGQIGQLVDDSAWGQGRVTGLIQDSVLNELHKKGEVILDIDVGQLYLHGLLPIELHFDLVGQPIDILVIFVLILTRHHNDLIILEHVERPTLHCHLLDHGRVSDKFVLEIRYGNNCLDFGDNELQ